MDVAASVVSLIQFTIKGIQTIQKIARSVKEGPDTVVYVAKHASDLLHILQRLESSVAIAQSRDTRLLESMTACNGDVTRMAEKLARAGFKADDNLSIRLWKTVKSAVKEQEWKEFQTKLHEYSNSMLLFLSVQDSDKLFDMSRRMDSGYELMHDKLMSLIAKCDSIETRCARIEASARNPQFQGVIDAVRQDIQGQLQLLASRHETRVSEPSCTGNVGETKCKSEVTRDVVEDIATLVDSVKSLIAEAGILQTSGLPGYSQHWIYSATVLGREVHFAPDISPRFQSREHVNVRVQAADRQAAERTTSDVRLPCLPGQRLSTAVKEKQWTLKDILQSSRSVEAFFSRESVRPAPSSIRPTPVNRTALSRLQQWSKRELSSQMLWLNGRYTPKRGAENYLTRIGMNLVELATYSDVPVVSYFCQPGRSVAPRTLESPEEEVFTSTLYAFVHQMLRLLPTQFEADVDLSEERFRRLNGTKASWGDSVRILNDMIPLLKPTVYCILDGVQWIEHSNTDEHLSLFVDALKQEPMRVLFITSGLSRVLRDTLSKEETLTDEELGVGRLGDDLQRHAQAFWKG